MLTVKLISVLPSTVEETRYLSLKELSYKMRQMKSSLRACRTSKKRELLEHKSLSSKTLSYSRKLS